MLPLALRRPSVRRAAHQARNAVLDRIGASDPAQVFVLALGFLLIAGVTVFVMFALSGDPSTESPGGELPRLDRASEGPVRYANREAGYGFTYPPTWDLTEQGSRVRLHSPNGRIVVTFDLGGSDGLEATSIRALETFGPDQELIGTIRQRIDGSASLLTSGTTRDQAGRALRFLVIAVRAEPRDGVISIAVPAGSDPGRVLPLVEEIVASFEIEGAGPDGG